MNAAEHLEEEQIEFASSHAKLWLKAVDACTKKLKRAPSNEDMVDFALSKQGKFIRHLFPFDDLKGSARKHWIALAGYYTRKAVIVFASDPDAAPVRVRALHFVKNEDGSRGAISVNEVVNNTMYLDQVIAETKSLLLAVQNKCQTLTKISKNEKLRVALEHATKALEALE